VVRVGGPRVSHGTITVNSVRVVTVISVAVGGVQLTRVSGAVRGSGLFAPVRLGGARPVAGSRGGLFEITSMIIANDYRMIPKHP
jgi:hypothetical protein